MSGGSPHHSLIGANIGREVGNVLKGQPCLVFNSDLRVTIMPTGLKTYPDVTVVCGEPYYHPLDKDSLINPTVLFEVLSPTTEGYDRGAKWAHYRRLNSLQEYVLVSQDKARIEKFERQNDGSWKFTEANGLDESIALESPGIQLSLAEVYTQVRLPAEENEHTSLNAGSYNHPIS